MDSNQAQASSSLPKEVPSRTHIKQVQATLELYCLGDARAVLNGRTLALSRRQLETLSLLALHPAGLSGAELAQRLYGDETKHTKSLLFRLRRVLALESSPYQLCAHVKADFLELRKLLNVGRLTEATRLYQGALLPWSDAPGITEERSFLEACLTEAAMKTRNTDVIYKLCMTIDHDLGLWESLSEMLPSYDPRQSFASAKVSHIQASW